MNFNNSLQPNRTMRAGDLVGLGDIADHFRVSKATVCNWTRRYTDFPGPVAALSCGDVWAMTDILRWYHGRRWAHPGVRDDRN